MFKREVFTTVTPLPFYVQKSMVVKSLQDHEEMINLNPLVVAYKRCDPPRNAPVDEFYSLWYELTDKIRYIPGISGKVSYKACFHDLTAGLQTHVYAPTGLDIREKWSVEGEPPGEPRQPIELGLTNAPREGFYLREDVNMYCSGVVSGFVKKKLKLAHETLVQRLIVKAYLLRLSGEDSPTNASISSSRSSPSFYGESVVEQYELPVSSYQTRNALEIRATVNKTARTSNFQSLRQMDENLIPRALQPRMQSSTTPRYELSSHSTKRK
uniref:DUF7053 domain-containing protein n=1 Tax=Talaromyces marneffei PM1 TaxID=1077442 RepID=A0A093UNE5_TALMA